MADKIATVSDIKGLNNSVSTSLGNTLCPTKVLILNISQYITIANASSYANNLLIKLKDLSYYNNSEDFNITPPTPTGVSYLVHNTELCNPQLDGFTLPTGAKLHIYAEYKLTYNYAVLPQTSGLFTESRQITVSIYSSSGTTPIKSIIYSKNGESDITYTNPNSNSSSLTITGFSLGDTFIIDLVNYGNNNKIKRLLSSLILPSVYTFARGFYYGHVLVTLNLNETIIYSNRLNFALSLFIDSSTYYISNTVKEATYCQGSLSGNKYDNSDVLGGAVQYPSGSSASNPSKDTIFAVYSLPDFMRSNALNSFFCFCMIDPVRTSLSSLMGYVYFPGYRCERLNLNVGNAPRFTYNDDNIEVKNLVVGTCADFP